MRLVNPCHQIKFNDELAIDVFEIIDGLIDMTTHYHIVIYMARGGTPPSKICVEEIISSWLFWAGAPRAFIYNQGVRNRGRNSILLQSQGIELRRIGARIPRQFGTIKQHGGLLKEMLKRAIHHRQFFGASVVLALCSEYARAKNGINNQQFFPIQWVLGHIPKDLSNLASQDPENHLGVYQGLIDTEEKIPQE